MVHAVTGFTNKRLRGLSAELLAATPQEAR
jgi:hypothetical protein